MEQLKPGKLVRSLLESTFNTRYWVVVVKRRPWLRNFFIFLSTLFFLGIAGLGAGYWYFYFSDACLFDFACMVNDKGSQLDLSKPGKADFPKSTIIYDIHDIITGRFFYENRDPVKASEVSDLVKNGFIAAEDRRFNPDRPKKVFPQDYVCDPLYKYLGGEAIDPCAFGRAGLYYLMRIGNISGASGLPVQNVRHHFSNEVSDFHNRKRSPWRKIKEARIAIRLVRRYPRDNIITDILNMPYFGRGANGIAEAAWRYFGKNVRKGELTLQEIAILVSMNKSAAKYSPIFVEPAKDDPEYQKKRDKEKLRMSKARDRYNWVLGRMLEDGYITKEQYDSSLFKTDEDLDKSLASLYPLKNPDFEYGNRIVKEFLFGQGYTEDDLSRNRGLRVYTTIDSKIQHIASDEFEKHLAEINSISNLTGYDRIDGAFIIMDVKTGNILALSGGHDFNETQFNRVFATRSPGSGFKPFVYAAAMEKGMGYFDQVCNCSFAMRGANGKTWAPRNFTDRNPLPMGYTDMGKCLIASLNLGTLNLAKMIGMDAVMQTANSMGLYGNPGIVRDSDGNIWFRKPGYEIRGGMEPTLPTAIGASGLNLVEMATAYSVFYRNGRYIHPTLIKEIRGTYGEPIFKAETPEPKQVISEDTAAKMVGLQRGVTKLPFGTAKISMRNIEQQVACKTGTSNGPKDISIWCGTPEIFIGIRLGHDDYSRNIELPQYMKEVSGDITMLPTGGWIVGPLARKIIDRIYSDRAKVPFSPEIENNLQILLDKYQGVK